LNPYKLFVEFLFGMVGTGYFLYGKRRGNMAILACGLGLGLFPYFVENWFAILAVGAILLIAPFLIRGS
jgi:hypothetical protein